MTDKELLELAAKAAGFSVWTDIDGNLYSGTSGTEVNWNPLTDDGDALRLAVKLGLWVHCGKCDVSIEGTRIEIPCGNDPYAATRRAIVRAAAQIGETK